MVENIKKINNPLTIIAIFAALAEVNATVAIGLINKDLHYIFIWFIIGFPSLLVIIFFLTLNFNTKVMYSPSDYKDDKSFMDSIFGGYYGTKKNENSESALSEKIARELETKINQLIQPRLELLEKENDLIEVKKEINNIKKELQLATKKSAKELSSISLLSTELKSKMLNLYRFPALYLPIYAIVKSSAKNISELKTFANDFFIPGKWEKVAMQKLISEAIILGDITNFHINPDFEKELCVWVDNNSDILNKISNIYETDQHIKTTEERNKAIEKSRIIAENLIF